MSAAIYHVTSYQCYVGEVNHTVYVPVAKGFLACCLQEMSWQGDEQKACQCLILSLQRALSCRVNMPQLDPARKSAHRLGLMSDPDVPFRLHWSIEQRRLPYDLCN